jgi:hypothetical protein
LTAAKSLLAIAERTEMNNKLFSSYAGCDRLSTLLIHILAWASHETDYGKLVITTKIN